MSLPSPNPYQPDRIKTAAAKWLARRDRGLTPAEQDDFLAWLAESPAHREALQRLQQAWAQLDLLAEWRPEHAATPNPDLLNTPPEPTPTAPVAESVDPSDEGDAVATTVATAEADIAQPDFSVPAGTRSRPWWRHAPWMAGALVAAALVLVVQSRDEAGLGSRGGVNSDPTGASDVVAGTARRIEVEPIEISAREAQRQRLPDGSLVDMNAGSRIEVAYSAARRDLRLLAGEAHFTVVHDPARPFVVTAAGMKIRAVGTAFNVRLSAEEVEVLVTHGRVAVDAREMTPDAMPDPFIVRDGALLSVGERAIVSFHDGQPQTAVTTVPPAEMAAELAWQPQALEFSDTPLSEVVGVFNGGNARQLAIDDPALEQLRIEGNFRLNNVDAFVRLLEAGFGVQAVERADGVTVLQRSQR